MRVESGGQMYQGGRLTTSGAGAMGLMQVMPGTYEELRARYDLGDDPFDPHDNILAGAAYIREMYELYGAPGFPRRLQRRPAPLRRLRHAQPPAAERNPPLRGQDRPLHRRPPPQP